MATKYVFVTGGVASALGKGITAALTENTPHTHLANLPSRLQPNRPKNRLNAWHKPLHKTVKNILAETLFISLILLNHITLITDTN